MFRIKTSLTLLMATTFISVAPQYALAQWGSTSTDVNAPHQPVIRAAFTSRFEEIRSQIRSATTTGRLSAASADAFNAQLNSISFESDQAFATNGGASNDELQPLMAKLQNLAAQVTQTINSSAAAGTIPTTSSSFSRPPNWSGGGWGRGQGESAGQLNQRITALQQRIATASAAGQISSWDMRRFKNTYDHIVSRRDKAMQNGRMNRGESRDIDIALDRVNSDLDVAISRGSALNTGPLGSSHNAAALAAIDHRISALQTRISTATTARQISMSESRKFSADYEDIVKLRGSLLRNGISNDDARTLNQALDRVNIAMDATAADGPAHNPASLTQVDGRITALEKRINLHLNNRQISDGEARGFMSDYNDIVRMRHRTLREGLTVQEARDINLALDRVNRSLDAAVADGPPLNTIPVGANFNNRLDDLRDRINRGGRRGALTSTQVRTALGTLRGLDRLASQLNINAAPGSVNAVQLNAQIDALNTQVNAWMSASR